MFSNDNSRCRSNNEYFFRTVNGVDSHVFENKRNLTIWLTNLHNEVNHRSGKMIMTQECVDEMYNNGRCRVEKAVENFTISILAMTVIFALSFMGLTMWRMRTHQSFLKTHSKSK